MNTEVSPEEREDLRLLYQASIADLAFFKSQQWAIANYTLLMYAGLISVQQLLKTSSCPERAFLLILTVGVIVSAAISLNSLKGAIDVRQKRLEAVREKLSETFRESWGAMDKGAELLPVAWVLYAVVIGGGLLTGWLVAYRL